MRYVNAMGTIAWTAPSKMRSERFIKTEQLNFSFIRSFTCITLGSRRILEAQPLYSTSCDDILKSLTRCKESCIGLCYIHLMST